MKTKKTPMGKDVQPNGNKRVASLRSTNSLTSNQLETKGMLLTFGILQILIS